MKLKMLLTFVANLATELTAAFTANGQMGYRSDGTEGFVGQVGGVIKRFLMEGDIVATAPASETQTGVVQIATSIEFAAGTDDDGAGSALVPKPSDVKGALDTKVIIAGDLTGTAAVPLVASSTQDSGLLVKNTAGTQQARVKATGAAELSVRTAADDAFAALQSGSHTVNGDLTVSGNVTFNGGSLTEIKTQEAIVKDNRMLLNEGEAGAGITAGTAGFDFDRGSLDDASFIFDETDDTFKIGIGAILRSIARKYAGTIGAASTSHVVTHSLGTKDVQVSVYDGDELVLCDVATSTIDTVTLTFSVAVTGYRVVVVG